MRPEYRTPGRIHPYEGSIRIPVACEAGRRANGQPTAKLPLLGVRFDCAKADEVADLAKRYARQKLDGAQRSCGLVGL